MIKIGIDPDISKSGFCILLNNEVKELSLLSFFDLTAHLLELKEYYDNCKQKYVVVIEKGESNKALFNAKGGAGVANKIAMQTGKNFAVTELLIEFCDREKIPYKLYVPKSAKWSHDYTKKIVKNLPKQTNPDKRDAIRAAVMG